eukprot:Hpha_TRINITY_DN7442_c0_g1::TRINITY_DN7442_c0_g1_i1::g.95760::m.95760
MEDRVVVPSVISYGTALRACQYSAGQEVGESTRVARGLWDTAVCKRRVTSRELGTIAMAVAARAGDAEWAEAVRKIMHEFRLGESRHCFESYCEALRRGGRVDDAKA